MELSNIFKMELFKNRTDKSYLLIIAFLTLTATISTVLWILSAENLIGASNLFLVIMSTMSVFVVLGVAIFSLLYPFHLLNVDYKNKVISLIFASGVDRVKYYFVKIGATILSTLTATFIIFFFPMLSLLTRYSNIIIEGFQSWFIDFNYSYLLLLILVVTVAYIKTIIILTTSVIITKGSIKGIFLYFGFSLLSSFITSGLFVKLEFYNFSSYSYQTLIISVVESVIFVLIGINVLKKQYL